MRRPAYVKSDSEVSPSSSFSFLIFSVSLLEEPDHSHASIRTLGEPPGESGARWGPTGERRCYLSNGLVVDARCRDVLWAEVPRAVVFRLRRLVFMVLEGKGSPRVFALVHLSVHCHYCRQVGLRTAPGFCRTIRFRSCTGRSSPRSLALRRGS